MQQLTCVICRSAIMKSGFKDPYLCRDCENTLAPEQLGEFWLDRV